MEDLALASSLALIAENKISFQTAFMACFLGISVGDVGLYFIGYSIKRFGIDTHFKIFKKHRTMLTRVKRSSALTYSIVISRAIPGTRLPTYLAAGFLKYPFINFLILTIASVFAWVLIALLGGRSLHAVFMESWINSLIAFLLFLHVLKTFLPKLTNYWQRQALVHSWRRWTHFEFWPAWFFYLPIAPYYIYLSLRYRSFLMPFYASPKLKHGGLIGESKWDFLQHLDEKNPTTLNAIKLGKDLDFLEAKLLLEKNAFSYPFIMKPDVGQRGFGVRIIRNDFDFTEYLLLSDFERIVQKLSDLPNEAGIFYIRRPDEPSGFIFSITDKQFPSLVGDGQTRLGNLILKDSRARIIAPVYFARHSDQLNTIPQLNEIVPISECGNHCQGAIFKNGHSLITDDLTFEIDRLAKSLPDFFFGRFDIRYSDANSLKLGKKFEIVEINGAGAEATHIWDKQTHLLDAYRTLFKQWKYLFEIGAHIRKSNKVHTNVDLWIFFKDCLKVALRKSDLSVSS